MFRILYLCFKLTLIIAIVFDQTDKTLEEEAVGEDVVDAVIAKISGCDFFPDDKGILKRIAYVESKYGKDKNTFKDKFRKPYHGGIWQIDSGPNGTYTEMTKERWRHAKIDKEIIPKIEKKFGIQWSKLNWQDCRKPLLSGIFARLRLFMKDDPIPANENIMGQANY